MVKVIPEKIQDEIVNFLESFHQLKPFFDEDSWKFVYGFDDEQEETMHLSIL